MFDYVARQYHWYKLEFGLTMLSWWEVSIFSAQLLTACYLRDQLLHLQLWLLCRLPPRLKNQREHQKKTSDARSYTYKQGTRRILSIDGTPPLYFPTPLSFHVVKRERWK
ncbi:hypothetical protein PsorP6_014276 [Peronosclerospora sorghi]|uniref:Uncharacterized protein n=1 Tax=Peronosclerospora sorghi TaxID=230839 RepID=A0ACC0VJL6_9STRA|nr:hypothetical protein PsorP6_014276 [Peronosclerospora sorghi]